MVLSNGFFYERIQLDTINERFNKVPTAKEGDANGRGMIVVLTENGLVKNTTGVSLLFKWEHTRIAGSQGLEDFEPLDLTKGEYIVTYPTEMNHEGYVKAEIRIIDNGKYAGSRNMKIQVEPSVGDDTAMESSNQFSALVTALLEVNSWNARIDAVEADFIQRAKDVEATYPRELVSLTSQLAETNAQVDLLNRGLGETFATLTDLQTAYPTGDTKDHIVGADGHRYFWNDTAWADGGAYQAVELIDGAVTINKTDFIKQDGNLLDYTLVTLNKYLENGNPVNNIWGWGVTNFIEVKEGLSYFASDTQYSFFYDANMSVVSAIASPTLFIIPIGVKYVRFSIENALTYAQKFMVLQTDQVPTHYVPYEYIYTKMHIDDGSITPEKTSFFTSKLNIDINWENAKTIDIWNGKTADFNNNYHSSDFVNISPNTDYFVGFPHFIYFYSSKGTFLSYANNSAGTVITTPANAYYIRFVIFDITPNNLVFYRGNVPKTYADVTPHLSVDSLKFGITNLDFSVNNLFDVATFVTGGSINPPDGVEISVPANGRTGLISVTAGEQYYINFRFFIFYYNSDGTYITALADSTCYYPKEFSVPDGVSQIRLVMADYTQDLIDNAVVLHVEKNTTKSYIPSSYVSPSFDKNNYNNMKFTTLGDSITEGNTWQPFLSSVLGINIIKNAGVGGTTVADYAGLVDKTLYMASDSRINTIPSDTQMLIFMGGSNDWSQNIPIGNISDSTKDTFYGAYQMVLDKVYARVPNARILLMLQPFRKDMYSNANGNVLQDYRDATEKIAKKYGYPLINTLEAGINQLNATTFLQDVVHPNAAGGKRIAEVIIGKLKSIEPIV